MKIPVSDAELSRLKRTTIKLSVFTIALMYEYMHPLLNASCDQATSFTTCACLKCYLLSICSSVRKLFIFATLRVFTDAELFKSLNLGPAA